MIYGTGYVSDNGGQFKWEQYLEWNNLIPVHLSDSLISGTLEKLTKMTDSSVNSFLGKSYIINGVLIFCFLQH